LNENPPREQQPTSPRVALLRREHEYLQTHLPRVVDNVINEMYRNNSLSIEEKNRICEFEDSNEDRAAMLMTFVQSGGDQKFNGFRQALRDLHYDDILARLNDRIPVISVFPFSVV